MTLFSHLSTLWRKTPRNPQPSSSASSSDCNAEIARLMAIQAGSPRSVVGKRAAERLTAIRHAQLAQGAGR